jgi:hypothetical protein
MTEKGGVMMDVNDWLRILDDNCRDVAAVLEDLRRDPSTALAGEKLSALFQEYQEYQAKLLDEIIRTED